MKITRTFFKDEEIMATQTNGGVTGLELLLIVFIVLKLVGVIHWSWWWVLSPFWIPAAIVLTIILIVALARAGR